MRKFGILFAALAAIVAVMAIPGTASARHAGAPTGGNNCDYVGAAETSVVNGDLRDVNGEGLVVYVGSEGTNDQADVVVGACLDSPNQSNFDGGTLECGVGEDKDTGELVEPDTYCVADGDDDNENANSAADGYVGLSSYEQGDPADREELDTGCKGSGTGNETTQDDTNGGGCFAVKGVVACNTDDVDLDQDAEDLVCDTDDVSDGDTRNGPEVEHGLPTPICGNDTGNQWESSSRDGCAAPDDA